MQKRVAIKSLLLFLTLGHVMVGGGGGVTQVPVNGLDKFNRRLFSEELESLQE